MYPPKYHTHFLPNLLENFKKWLIIIDTVTLLHKNHRNGSYFASALPNKYYYSEPRAFRPIFLNFGDFFWKNGKKIQTAPPFSREGGCTRGVNRRIIRKLHPCRLAWIMNQNRISTMGQVTGGQSRVVKPKIAIFRLCSLRPNASKMGAGCTQILGAGRVNNSEYI